MDSQLIQKKRGLSPVWILPLLALCIGGWLLYTTLRDAGIPITIHFTNAEGITPGKTQVMYKGVGVGVVESISVDDDLQGVNLFVKMEKKTKNGLVEDTKFWVVKPEISAGRISGLETLFSGSYIAVQMGSSTVQARQFEGLTDTPVLPADSPGLHMTLKSEALYSLQKGSPVYAKNLRIGKVEGYHLAEDNSILIDLYIEEEFSHLIREGTRFWNASGLSFEGNLQSGFSLRMQSMAALIYGGIACGTPQSLQEKSLPATNGMVFQLYSNYEAAEYGLAMTLQLASGGGIIEGKTKVLYRGLEAGVVKKISINNDEPHTVTAKILLDPRAEPILKQETRFWVVRPEVSIDGIRNLDTIIAGPYITFQPGTGSFQDHFVVEEGPKPQPPGRPGREYVLISADSGSLEPGSPLFYKKMVIGEVRDLTFGPDAQSVHIDFLIYNEYTHLITEKTVFWNVSGIRADAGLTHINFRMASLKTLLAGGVALLNPEEVRPATAKTAPEGHSFTLYDNFGDAANAVPALRPQGLAVYLQSGAENAFEVGSPILYEKIQVGEVTGLTLSDDLKHLVYEAVIFKKYAGLVTASTLFYNVSGLTVEAALTGVEIRAESLASIVSGGIGLMNPKPGARAPERSTFTLYPDRQTALYRDGTRLTLHLEQADGIGAGTRIKYQGVDIGRLTSIAFGAAMQELIAEGIVTGDAKQLLRDSTRFWLVRPKISLAGVEHLSTALSGSYIAVLPGSGEPRTEFTLLEDAPEPTPAEGLSIVLEAPRLGSLQPGSPVYYRQVLVGQVTGFELSPTAQQVWIRTHILPAYTDLVHTGSKFWSASGIKASMGLVSGFSLETESLESVITGGVAFATPDGEKMGKPAAADTHFTLHEKNEQSWLDWNPEIMLNGRFTKTAEPDNTASTDSGPASAASKKDDRP